MQLHIINFSKSHIHAKAKFEEDNFETCFLTGIYGQPDTAKCHETWSIIGSLQMDSDKAWLPFGDFNEILSNREKRGGRVRLERQMSAFKTSLDDCELHDLGFKGP